MNQCTFLGRLTADPEIRYAQETQMPIARFTVAVNRWKSEEGEQDADFFPCVVFNQKAEFAEKYLRGGMRILVSGSMRNNHYTNKNGEKVYGTELLGNLIEFADGKRDTDANGSQEQAVRRAGQSQTGAAGTRNSANMGNAAAGNAGAGAAAGGRTGAASNQASPRQSAVSGQAASRQSVASGQAASRQGTASGQAAPRQRTASSQTTGRQQASPRQSAVGTASSRSQTGRTSASRQSTGTTAAPQGGGFMNIPDGIDDGLPFR